MKVITVSSGADEGQFHHENVMSTAFIFSWGLSGVLGGSSGGNSGGAQGQMRGSFIMKKIYPLHLFFSWGLSKADRGQLNHEKVISPASTFL